MFCQIEPSKLDCAVREFIWPARDSHSALCGGFKFRRRNSICKRRSGGWGADHPTSILAGSRVDPPTPPFWVSHAPGLGQRFPWAPTENCCCFVTLPSRPTPLPRGGADRHTPLCQWPLLQGWRSWPGACTSWVWRWWRPAAPPPRSAAWGCRCTMWRTSPRPQRCWAVCRGVLAPRAVGDAAARRLRGWEDVNGSPTGATKLLFKSKDPPEGVGAVGFFASGLGLG